MSDRIAPKWMQHPHCRPPYIDRQNDKNSRGIYLAPLQVHSVDQEAYARSQGYEDCPNNIPDPNQYRPVYGSGDTAGGAQPYVHQEYPMWVDGVLVKNEAEHLALLEKTMGSEPEEKEDCHVAKRGRPRKVA